MRLDSFIRINTEQSHKSVRQLLAKDRIRVNGAITQNRHHPVTDFCHVQVDGITLQNRTAIYLMLHKPAGYLSATQDAHQPTVMELIDKDIQAQLHIGGRLDKDSTGLLLLTNDGNWSRRITDPGLKKPKRYLVETQDAITPEYATAFEQGVYLEPEALTTQPAQLERLEPRKARLTIYEGRYHQVKRIFGAFDNRVVKLHRESMGPIELDPKLRPGEWRPLTATEIESV
jgi:16S rRNA pseudouridine516 synthase